MRRNPLRSIDGFVSFQVYSLVSLLELTDHVLEDSDHQLFFGFLLDAIIQYLLDILGYDLLDFLRVVLGAINVHSGWLLQQRVLAQVIYINLNVAVSDRAQLLNTGTTWEATDV